MKKSKMISLIVVVSLFLCSCRHYGDYNMRPDDDLSHAMHDAVGEDFYYLGKEESESGEIWYRYAIQKTESNAIEEFGNAITALLIDEQKKIEITVYVKISGGLESIFRMRNYSDSKLKIADYEGIYLLYIQEPRHTEQKLFYDPSTYTGRIEGVKRLIIDSAMQQKAEEEGIDWYACWPDLEEIVVEEDGAE